ncbi:MAG: Polyketide synthase PksL, partial [Planctomycetota bacterium]
MRPDVESISNSTMNHQTKQVERNSPIAIVGMGIVFPGADRPEDFWNVVVHGQCKAEQIASDRWPVDPKLLFEPRGIRSDSVYSLTACLIDKDWRPDPTGIPLPPDVNGSSLDPVFGLAIHAAAAAWRNARTEKLNRDRVSVILGNIALPTESTAAWSQELFSWELAGRSEEPRRLTEPNSWNRDPIAFPAKLISQALRLGGRSFTLDAACASSLYALKLGMDELRDGRADAVLAGGLSRPDCLYTQMGFAQLHALSHNGLPRPFDESGDGLVVGEGAGIFLLKRLDDALAQGDKILGVLRAVGLSNDVSGALLAPSSEGQLRAMKAAYEECGLSPDQMDTIECHATGTPVGDSEEFRSLLTLWENTDSGRNVCVLGSVKSNIGHGLTSAGAAGLAKLLLAFEHGVFPPTAGFQKPRVTLDIDGSPFRILKKAEPWQRRSPQTPRRAALSGFGFGGINAHLIVEEYLGQSFEMSSDPDRKQEFEVAVSGLGGRIGPHEGLGQLARALVHGQFDELENPLHWYGVGTSEHFDDEDSRQPKVVGYLAETVDVPIGKFRIPPAELQEILPQQAMILNAAYEAASQAGWLAKGSKPRLRTAVLLGVSLDQGTNHFQLRWALTDPGKDHHQPSAELKEARDTLGPPLTANRVMGNLASIAASRLAREFRLGGPSFTISEGPDAGLTALETAYHWIASGVIDEAIVGAVDLTSDLRHSWSQWLASKQMTSRLVICDSALAVIIRRKSEEPLNRAMAYVSLTHKDKKNASASAKFQPDPIPELYGGAATSLIGWVRQCLGIIYRIKPSKEFPWIVNDSKINERAHYWMAEKTGIPREILTKAASSDYLFRIRENLGLERSELPTFHYRSSAGIFLLSAKDRDGLIRETRLLANWFTDSEHESKSPSELADLWWNRQNDDETFGDERLALVLWKVSEAIPLLKQAVDHIQTGTYHGPKRFASQSDYIYFPNEQSRSGELAFVFPGMGSGFAGMGQEISARWPSAFDQICSEWSCPETELLPGLFWNMDFPDRADHHCDLIFGQAALGMAISVFVRRFGVEPNAMMGLSLGESVQLLASGVWEDHDELWQRMRESSLFKSELAGECRAARRYWELSDEEPVDWLTVVVPKPLDQVKAAISSEPRVNILIIDAPNEVVLGGQREAVERVLRQIKCRKVPVGIVSTMHSPLALSVREEYLKLHTLAIHDPSPLRLYSAVFGRSYQPTSKNCAEAITGLSYQTVDFVSLVEQAYRDGIRTFVEIGPGSSCSRM